MKVTPRLLFAVFRGRNVSPQNVNETCSYVPRRLLSLQYTILVLSG